MSPAPVLSRAIAAGLLAAGLLATLAGCTAPDGATDPPVEATAVAVAPFDDCAGIATPSTVVGATTPAGGEALVELVLPCFTGGRPVHTGQIRGPAVINLWASWCAPCRQELPALQRYADRAGDRVRLIGVVTEDTRGRAASLAVDLRLTFPTLYDETGQLRRALLRTGLPITLLVDAGGRVRHVYHGTALDDDRLDRLVREHLGIAG